MFKDDSQHCGGQNAERTHRHSQPASRHYARALAATLGTHTRAGFPKPVKPSPTSDPDLSSGNTPHPLRFDSTKMIWLVNLISSFPHGRSGTGTLTPPPATKKVRFRHGCALGNRLTDFLTIFRLQIDYLLRSCDYALYTVIGKSLAGSPHQCGSITQPCVWTAKEDLTLWLVCYTDFGGRDSRPGCASGRGPPQLPNLGA